MILINLLAWRERKRNEKKRQCILLLFTGLVITACFIGLVYWALSVCCQQQNRRNAYLQREIDAENKKLQTLATWQKTKADLFLHLNGIEQLQTNRANTVKLLAYLTQQLPSAIVLTCLRRKDNKISINGIANNHPALSIFMSRIKRSKLFKDLTLKNIQTKSYKHITKLYFSFTVIEQNRRSGL